MNVKQWVNKIKDYYKLKTSDAEKIVMKVMGYDDKSSLITNEKAEVRPRDARTIRAYADRRAYSKKPLAYIFGEKEFYGLPIKVDERVLIPRPETEDMVDMVMELEIENPTVMDVGTGSGCISVALMRRMLEMGELPRFIAIDKSADALEVAKENIGLMQDFYTNFEMMPVQVEYLENDLLSGLDAEQCGQVNIVVANLPYVDVDWDWLDKEALGHEPKEALYAKDGGLKEIKRLIDQLEKFDNGDYVFLEADPCQHEEIIKYAKTHGLKHFETRNYILGFERK